jgi:pimeloyl-ACP methyl ester carboxylesterase
MIRFLAALLCLWLAASPAAAFDRIGVVLLHGKTGDPSQFTSLAHTLDETGYAVEAPEMCWSAHRIYDEPLAACFADVDAAIARLAADGFDGIVVGGHSLGGLAALAYAASRPGLAGIIALAPDGEPADFNRHTGVAASVRKAEALVKAGKGDVVGTFTDRVLGRNLPVKATPRAFLSFLGNDSQLDPATLLPKLAAPLLWVAGTRDSSQRNARTLFKKAPANPLSQYVIVNASHLGTPDAATITILDWLDRLARE